MQLKNPTRDRRSHQITVHSCLQDPAVANALQKVKLVPCLPSVQIPSGESPIFKYENFMLRTEQFTGNLILNFDGKSGYLVSLGSPAEGFLFPLDPHRMITNVDARENAQTHYDHSIVKYKCHNVDNSSGQVITPPSFSIMAQHHKETTAGRWLQDYLGQVKLLDHGRKVSGEFANSIISIK